MEKEKKRIAIIGAGPAGLTAAYQLGKAGREVIAFEKDAQYVGGISRTETYNGFLFDIGGHRFFSKSKEVEDFWTEILGDDMIEVPRSSRIYYNKKFFSYPLVAAETLKKLGIVTSALCIMSYLNARLKRKKKHESFEDWVSHYFGKKLYSMFFKTYTEKVWGIPCSEISSDWASQRIKGLSLSTAIRHALIKQKKSNNNIVKTLIDSFRYPKKGPGMMWEKCAEKAVALGVTINMNAGVKKLYYENSSWSLILEDGSIHDGFDYVISSAPLKELASGIYPSLPAQAVIAANKLKYRDFITVVLIMPDKNIFSDNWIYIHDPSVKVGRIQNFKSWSPYMVPDNSMACYGLEYFCFEGDGLWNSSNEVLINLAKNELQQIGLGNASEVLDGHVVRQAKAYPVYDKNYKTNVSVIKQHLLSYPGLYLTGRNGMHKYNNQDHSMMTAMLAAKNIIAGKELFDLWKVNGDAAYQEEGEIDFTKNCRLIPEKLDKIKITAQDNIINGLA